MGKNIYISVVAQQRDVVPLYLAILRDLCPRAGQANLRFYERSLGPRTPSKCFISDPEILDEVESAIRMLRAVSARIGMNLANGASCLLECDLYPLNYRDGWYRQGCGDIRCLIDARDFYPPRVPETGEPIAAYWSLPEGAEYWWSAKQYDAHEKYVLRENADELLSRICNVQVDGAFPVLHAGLIFEEAFASLGCCTMMFHRSPKEFASDLARIYLYLRHDVHLPAIEQERGGLQSLLREYRDKGPRTSDFEQYWGIGTLGNFLTPEAAEFFAARSDTTAHDALLQIQQEDRDLIYLNQGDLGCSLSVSPWNDLWGAYTLLAKRLMS